MPQEPVVPTGAWQAAVMAAMGGSELVSSSIEHRNQTFTVTAQHLKLLRAATVAWSSQWRDDLDPGAPCIDPRRPYGDKEWARSMILILDYKMPNVKGRAWTEDDEIPDQQYNALEQIHQETEIALRICLNRGEFVSGTYYWPEPGEDWVEVGKRAADVAKVG